MVAQIDKESFAAARRASGLSQDNAASICGVSRPTYALREGNPAEFRLGDLAVLYRAMNKPGRKLLREGIMSLFLPEGVSHTTVWRWSTDEHVGEMTVSTLARLADVIGCEPCELFEGGASDEG